MLGTALQRVAVDHYYANVTIDAHPSPSYTADDAGLARLVAGIEKARSPIEILSQEVVNLPSGQWLVVETRKHYNDPNRVRTYHQWGYVQPQSPGYSMYFTELDGTNNLQGQREKIAATFQLKH